MIIAVSSSILTGKIEETATAAMTGASDAVTLSVSLLGVMCLWTGLMTIATESGLNAVFAKILRPITRILFPNLKQDSPAMDAIVMNMTANIFGMSNAATPLGMSAMRELNKHNRNGEACDNMCMFIVVNTASLQLIPTTILAMRQAVGSANSFEIIAPVWIASTVTLVAGVIFAKFFASRSR